MKHTVIMDQCESTIDELETRFFEEDKMVYRLFRVRVGRVERILIGIETNAEEALALLECDERAARSFFEIAVKGALSPIHLQEAAEDFCEEKKML